MFIKMSIDFTLSKYYQHSSLLGFNSTTTESDGRIAFYKSVIESTMEWNEVVEIDGVGSTIPRFVKEGVGSLGISNTDLTTLTEDELEQKAIELIITNNYGIPMDNQSLTGDIPNVNTLKLVKTTSTNRYYSLPFIPNSTTGVWMFSGCLLETDLTNTPTFVRPYILVDEDLFISDIGKKMLQGIFNVLQTDSETDIITIDDKKFSSPYISSFTQNSELIIWSEGSNRNISSLAKTKLVLATSTPDKTVLNVSKKSVGNFLEKVEHSPTTQMVSLGVMCGGVLLCLILVIYIFYDRKKTFFTREND